MALVTCRECNKQISDSANICPNCGFKRNNKNSNVVLILVLIGFLLLAMFLFKDKLKNGALFDEFSAPKETVRQRMNDPESANFSEVFNAKEDNKVCGFVNGKNKFGAYVGSKPFIYDKLTKDVDFVEDEIATDQDFITYYESVGKEDFQEQFLVLSNKCNSLNEFYKTCLGVEKQSENHSLCVDINSTLLIGKINDMLY